MPKTKNSKVVVQSISYYQKSEDDGKGKA